MTKYYLITLLLFCAHLAAADECKVVEQGGSNESSYCQAHGYPGDKIFRCYAVVEAKGARLKVWGADCWASATDCWFNGAGRVEPDCD